MNNIFSLIPDLEKKEEYYKAAMSKRYDEYIQYSQLPPAFDFTKIDTTRLPKRLNTLFTNAYEIVSDRLTFAFNVGDFANTGYISSLVINEYYKHCIINDVTAESVLYIDTNLLLDDFKKLIEKNESGNSPITAHSLDTLYGNIESAPFVIWDKFTLVNSNYDRQKLYNILSIRHRQGLGNLYFIKGGHTALGNTYDIETYNVMDIINIVDCSFEQLPFKEANNEKGTLRW